MAVKFPYREITARDTDTLTLPARPGSAFFVTRISAIGVANPGFATIQNGPSTVAFKSVGPPAYNHLAHPLDYNGGINMFDVYRMWGMPAEIPVAEGDALNVDLPAAADLIKIEYREVDPGDVSPDMPFGRQASELSMVLYGTNAGALGAGGYHALDQSQLPNQLTQFPFEALAETGREYQIEGILGQDIEETTAAAGEVWRTTHMRLTQDRETLFDVDRNGFVMEGDGATDAASDTIAAGGINQIPFGGGGPVNRLFRLPEPLMVRGGEELNIEQRIEVDAGPGAGAEALLGALVAVMRPAS